MFNGYVDMWCFTDCLPQLQARPDEAETFSCSIGMYFPRLPCMYAFPFPTAVHLQYNIVAALWHTSFCPLRPQSLGFVSAATATALRAKHMAASERRVAP